jgi:Ca2+-binding EF-hand superfamily protein
MDKLNCGNADYSDCMDKFKQKIIIGVSMAAISIGGYYLYQKLTNSSTETKPDVNPSKPHTHKTETHKKLNAKAIKREFELSHELNSPLSISDFSHFIDGLIVQPEFGISHERKKEFIAKLEKDKKSTVKLSSFLHYLEMPTKILDFSNLEKMFDTYDTNKDGVISASELRAFMDDWADSKGIRKVTDHQLKGFMTYLDQTGKGGLTFSDFRRWAIKFSDEFKWKQIHEYFNQYAGNKDSINQQDLVEFLKDLSETYKIPRPSIAQTHAFFEKIDKDHSGEISYKEFALWLYGLESDFKKDFNLREMFDLFDSDKNGVLDMEEWSHFLDYMSRVYGMYAPTEEEKQQYLDHVDVDHSGDINFDEFSNWYEKLKGLDKELHK